MRQMTFDFSDDDEVGARNEQLPSLESTDSSPPDFAAGPDSSLSRDIAASRVHRIRPPVKAHGGKYHLARHIVPILQTAPGAVTEYLEPCAFGASVFLAMPRHDREILGDSNPDVVNLWRVLSRTRTAALLADRLAEIPYSETQFRDAQQPSAAISDIEQATRFVIRCRFSRGGLGKSFAWSERQRGGRPGDENSWKTFQEQSLPEIIKRAHGIDVVSDPCWWTVWESRHRVQRLIYADPPYMPDTRTSPQAYGAFEMTRLHHFWLISALRAHTGPAAISGYRNIDYDRWLKDWRRFDVDVPNNAGQTRKKQRRTESLWINW